MDKVRKPNISESDTPSSESYSNYLYFMSLTSFMGILNSKLYQNIVK
jgi:hypothetical protein